MNYPVTLTKSAEKDLRNAVLFIRNELKNPEAARNLIDMADACFHSLSEFPYRCPLENDKILSKLAIRHAKAGSYLVFYVSREASQTVSVIRFLYGKRDWQKLLGELPDSNF